MRTGNYRNIVLCFSVTCLVGLKIYSQLLTSVKKCRHATSAREITPEVFVALVAENSRGELSPVPTGNNALAV